MYFAVFSARLCILIRTPYVSRMYFTIRLFCIRICIVLYSVLSVHILVLYGYFFLFRQRYP